LSGDRPRWPIWELSGHRCSRSGGGPVWDDAAVIEATRFGRLLPQGGCIGVPAPASPWENRSDLLRGVEWWQARGYRVKLADGMEARESYVAGDPRSRARDLEAMFADPGVDVVQCLTGGFGSMQLVPHLDFQLIADHPKAFCGYSDITALHVALRQRAGLATFYGPHLMTMGWTRASDLTRERPLAVLAGGGAGPVPADPTTPMCGRCAAAGPPGRWPGATCGCWPRPWARPGSWSWTGPSCSSRRSTRRPGTSTGCSPSSGGPASWPGSSGWRSATWSAVTGAISGRSGPEPSRWSRSWRSTWSPWGSRCWTGAGHPPR